MRTPPFLKNACEPVMSFVRRAGEDRGGMSDLPRILHGPSLADGTPQAAKNMERYGKLNEVWSNFWFSATSFNYDDLSMALRPHLTTAQKELWDKDGRQFILQFQQSSQQYVGALGAMMHAYDRMVKTGVSGTRGAAVMAAANFTSVARIMEVARMPARTAAEKAARHKAALTTLSNHMDEGLNEANSVDFVSFGVDSFEKLKLRTAEVVGSLRPSQTNSFLDAYAQMINVLEPQKKVLIANWRRSNPGSKLSDAAVLKEQGLGETIFSYATHMFENDQRNGYVDDFIENVTAQLGTAQGAAGIRTPVSRIGVVDMMRAAARASKSTPFKHAGTGISADSPESALRLLLPNLPKAGESAEGDAVVRAMAHKLVMLGKTGDDTSYWTAMSPTIKNAYLMQRYGMQGFVTDFPTVYQAYMRAAHRQIHLSPFFTQGGTGHEFLSRLATMDRPMAAAFSGHLRNVVGLAVKNDAAFHEMSRFTTGIAGLAYSSVATLNFGIPLPNILSIPMYLWPEASLDRGPLVGARRMFSAMAMTRNPAFRKVLQESQLTASYSSIPGTRARDLANDLWGYAANGDLLGAARISREGVNYLDFLAISETQIVRPISAALGAIRYLEKHGLGKADLSNLPHEALDAMTQEMIHFVSKSTVLGATSNAVPALQSVRKLPIVGPLASMFTSTPINIASSLGANLKAAFGPNQSPTLKKQAWRRLTMQAFAGTMIAGPYWFVPWWRELESTEEREGMVAFLNQWERTASFAGWMNIDLAKRVNPVLGVVNRIFPESGVAGAVLGPLGQPAVDTWDAIIGGDKAAQRRVAGVFAPMLGMPPSGVQPSPLQAITPGGLGLERMMRLALAAHSSPNGQITMGWLGLPVKTPEGFKVDSLGRPYGTENEFKRFAWGSRDLDTAMAASEGKRMEKKAERKIDVERQMRGALLDGRTDEAFSLLKKYAYLNPQITFKELEREQLMRQLPPRARQALSAPILEAHEMAKTAAERLAAGGLSKANAAAEKWVILVFQHRMQNPNSFRQPKGLILSAANLPPQ